MDPNGKVEKAAENALLKLVARYSMIAIVPLITTFGGVALWVGNQAWASFQKNTQDTQDAIKATGKSVDDLRLSITAITGAQSVLANRVDAHSDRFKGVDERNAAQDIRMDRQDTRLETLANRLWQALPGNMKGNP